VIEVCNLLAEDEVLEQRGTALAGRQDFLVLDWAADVRREEALRVVHLELAQVLAREALGLPGDVADVGVGALSLSQAQQADGGQECAAYHCVRVSTS
jgi:hypothetical protein